MPDGVQRAMTRQIRCAWEIYATTERGMSAGEALRAFDNWIDSIGSEAVAKQGSCWDIGPEIRVRRGECPQPQPVCILPHGHGGAHRGDRSGPGIAVEWMTRPVAQPTESDHGDA